MPGNQNVVGASRSLLEASEQDARTPRTPQNYRGWVLVVLFISFNGL